MSATAVLNLSRAGFTDAQVSALAEYFDAQMATKADIATLHAEIEHLRSDLSRDIAQLRSETDVKTAGLETKIADSKTETIKRVAGLLVAQGAAIVALIGFLPGMHP